MSVPLLLPLRLFCFVFCETKEKRERVCVFVFCDFCEIMIGEKGLCSFFPSSCFVFAFLCYLARFRKRRVFVSFVAGREKTSSSRFYFSIGLIFTIFISCE